MSYLILSLCIQGISLHIEVFKGAATETSDMIKIAVDFYKELFRKDDKDEINLADDFWLENDLVTREENESLEAPFTEQEIKDVVSSSYAEGAPGPDGIPFLFYQKL